MRRIKQTLVAFLTACLLAGAVAGTALAAPNDGWVKQGGSWYYYSDGEYDVGWNRIGGKWYFFSYKNGRMQTGWLDSKEGYYYLGRSGSMATGWKKIGGKWYYFSRSGVMQTGWKKIGGKWYYLNASGSMATGWKKVSGKWYYLNGSGAMQTGCQKIGGKLYWLGEDGALGTGGWITIGVLTDDNYFQILELTKKKAYADGSGALKTGWFRIDGKWYYGCDQGYVYTSGIRTIDGSFYYFDGNGAMADNGFVYYDVFNDTGDWYRHGVYATKSGKLRTGWFQEGRRSYYGLPESGELAICEIVEMDDDGDNEPLYGYPFIIDGKRCFFDEWGCYVGSNQQVYYEQ